MMIATTPDLPGYEVQEVLGEVFGLTSARATSARSSALGSSRCSAAS